MKGGTSKRKTSKADLNSVECPYAEHKYRCKKKKWCVVHPSHCAYQSYDILVRNKNLTKAFRRPKIVDRCQQSASVCRECIDEWLFDTIADILDERKQLKLKKGDISKEVYKTRKYELLTKFEELGDEYEALMAKCDEIDDKSVVQKSSSVSEKDTEPQITTSFRDMLNSALTRRSSKKLTPILPSFSIIPSEPTSEERPSPIRMPADLVNCISKPLGSCRGCVDNWYENEFEDKFGDERPINYLQSASFKKLGDQYSRALDKCSS